MATVRLDSRNFAPGRDGSAGNPYNNFGELPTPYTLVSGTDYELVRGSYWNTNACLLLPTLASLPITIKAVGPTTDPQPIIESYRMCGRAECVEVAIVAATNGSGTASGATTTGTYSVGDTVIALASAGTGTILAGGVVTFAGDINPYAVVSGDADVSTGGSITIAAPGLLVAMSGAKAIACADTLTTPQAGTNIWRVPQRFFGLVGGNVWCAAKDIADSAGYGSTLMTGPYQCSYGNCDGAYKLIYSVGNPVDTYGGLYLRGSSDADIVSGAAYRNAIIAAFQPAGGLMVDSIEFGHSDYGVRVAQGNGSAANPLMRDTKVTNCVFRNMLRPVFLGGNVNENFGYTGTRITDNYFENCGSTAIDLSSGAGGIRNDTLIERNVVNKFGQSISVAGIYVGNGAHTSDGSRVRVRYNTLSGGIGGNVWISDGYALYQEAGDFTAPGFMPTSDVEFSYNFLWNNDLNCVSNKPGKNILWFGNVGYAKPNVSPAHWGKFFNATFGSQYGGSFPSKVTIANNIGVGFFRFLFNGGSAAARWDIINNICTSPGTQGPYSSDAISWVDGDYTKTVVDGNNFFGFARIWYDGAVNRTAPPYVLNAITSDPAAELARLPVPTDPTVNYALMLGPGPAIQGGVVNLRYGTRLAA